MNSFCKISLIAVLFSGSLDAATLPTSFAETQIATGLDPTSLTIAPDGRVFVCEKAGRIRIIQNGVLLTTPFATLAVDNSNERGLQSVAFDPNFATNGYLYAFTPPQFLRFAIGSAGSLPTATSSRPAAN